MNGCLPRLFFQPKTHPENTNSSGQRENKSRPNPENRGGSPVNTIPAIVSGVPRGVHVLSGSRSDGDADRLRMAHTTLNYLSSLARESPPRIPELEIAYIQAKMALKLCVEQKVCLEVSSCFFAVRTEPLPSSQNPEHTNLLADFRKAETVLATKHGVLLPEFRPGNILGISSPRLLRALGIHDVSLAVHDENLYGAFKSGLKEMHSVNVKRAQLFIDRVSEALSCQIVDKKSSVLVPASEIAALLNHYGTCRWMSLSHSDDFDSATLKDDYAQENFVALTRQLSPGSPDYGRLGRGRYGLVFGGVDIHAQNTFVAIKKVQVVHSHQKTMSRLSVCRDVLEEVWYSRLAVHPNVLGIKDAFLVSDESSQLSAYLTMDFCANGNLKSHVYSKDSVLASYKPRWALELSGAVAAIHAVNVVHSDIKLENIFLTEDWHIKLGDFGLATVVDYHQYPPKGGTLSMLPPEFFKDKDGGFSYCLRAENAPVAAFSQDVWQMGLVFYEMETRHCFTREKMTNRRDSWGASTAIQSFMQDRSRQLASIQDSPIRDAIDRSLVEAPELRASAKNIHEKLVQELTHAR